MDTSKQRRLSHYTYTNKYLQHLEKKAGFGAFMGLAAGAHVVQNVATMGMIRSKKIAGNVANYAKMGFDGKDLSATRKTINRVRDGVISPEYGALKEHAQEAGKFLKEETIDKGHRMGKRELVHLRLLARGDFTKARKLGVHKTPAWTSLDV